MAREQFFDGRVPQTVTVSGTQVRLVRSAQSAGLPIVMTSPWPESLYAFRHVWPRLASASPLIALDLPGFGQSERRADFMSPSRMGEFLISFLDTLDFDRVHMVAPDVGTSAALFSAAEAPERFQSLTVGSGGASMDLLGEPLSKLVRSRFADLQAQPAGNATVERISTLMRNPPPAEIAEDYAAASQGQRYNLAADYVRAYAEDLPRLAERLPEITVRVKIISGRDDQLAPPSNGEFLASRLRHAEHVVFDTGHFVWEDDPAAYADAILDWIAG